jgi:NADH:ubiquinone oxidoreductase subunit F (NADH-binding)/Pyruvate/2-oxoacid:ferredoxin oxidoreductase delta subunit/(2Fe-2S) ferredoxin
MNNEMDIHTEEKSFLLEKVLKNVTGEFLREDLEQISLLKRDKVIAPVIYIGTGSCGLIAGAAQTLDAVKKYLADNIITARIVECGCIGFCSEEPVVDIHLPGKARISFRKVTEDKVEDILSAIFNRNIDEDHVLGQYKSVPSETWANVPFIDQLPFFALQQKIILKNAGYVSPLSINDSIARGGYKSFYKTVLNYTPEKVCDIVEISELRGRGGGGFSTGKKWKVALTTAGDQKYLICNAEESDPGAFMDRAIIEGDPHRLLEGIAIASYAIGASYAYIYIRSDYPRAVKILEEAIRQAKEYEILGQNIFGSGYNLNISIRQSAGAFVCGEETALIQSLEGKRGTPWAKPPYPAESGLFSQPTIVNNVETLANIPGILEYGPSWFKGIGTKTCKGTKLFSITGNVQNSGCIEVPMGTKLSDIIHHIGGGVKGGKKLKAVQIGGPSGVCIPASNLDVEIGYESLQDVGAVLGSGGLSVLDETVCMVDLSRYFIEFLQKESCGKCIPCREGTRRMLEILEGITKRPRDESTHETLERFKGVVQLESLAEVLRDTSLCGLGQNSASPLLSSLKWFREEFEEHIFDRHCSAAVCRDMRTFYIDVDACNGCNVCQKKCPENAIIGVVKVPHFIVENKCNGCGICFEVCKFNAIIVK